MIGRRATEVFPGIEEFGLPDVLRRLDSFVYRRDGGELVAQKHDTVAESDRSSFRFSSVNGNCRVLGMIVLAVLVAGLWSAKKSGEAVDLQMRRELVQQAVSIAAAVNSENIRMLSFTAEDKNRPAFRLLCDQLSAYAEVIGIRSLYTMALRDGEIVFGPESFPEGHPYASPPGTVYQKPTQKDFDLFKTAQHQIQGPASDEYGPFVTASAPVIDRVTGEVLAAVGIDVEAREWTGAVRRAQWISGGITVGLVAILFLSGLILHLRQRMSPEHAIRLRHTELLISLVFISALTVALAFYSDQIERNARRNTFYAIAKTKAEACVARFRDMSLMLEQLSGFFESCEHVGQDEFGTYCRKILQFGSVQNCLWIPSVPDESADLFVQTVRAGGMPDFSIWQYNAEGLREPATGRPVYYPVLYLEPMSSQEVPGYDEGSDPARAAAVQKALNSGLRTATDPVVLAASTNQQTAFLIFSRVYAENQKGLVAFAVRPEKLLGRAMTDGQRVEIDICLSQLRQGEESLLLAGSSPHCGRACWNHNESGLSLTVPVFCFGKAYTLCLTPNADWLAAYPLNNARNTGLLGALVTLLVSSLVGLLTSRRIKLEQLVDRRTAELQASEKFRDKMVANIGDVIVVIDRNGICRYKSPNVEKWFGWKPEEVIGSHALDNVQPSDLVFMQEFIADLMNTPEKTGTVECRYCGKDGTYKWIEFTGINLLHDPDICGILGNYHDITERKKAEERIRDLVNHLEIVREEERRHLARELHDDIGQIFTALKIDLMFVDEQCTCEGNAHRKMEDMKTLLSEGIQSVHSLCRELRPGALDDLSLEDALEGLISDWQLRNQIPCDFSVDLEDEALSDEIRTAVFRLTQESLTNVSRYAKASWVGINLTADGKQLVVSVTDNGCGMEAGAAEKPTSFGLLGMRERVESLGGTLQIDSAPGKGTRIEASIPLAKNG